MNGLLYFFDDHIKPRVLRGTRILSPQKTGKCPGGISAIREGDVNLWLYTKDDRTLAVDTGHINFPGIEDKFREIGIDHRAVRNVLLTHLDVDHAGGIDSKARWRIYENADIHIGEKEEDYLKKKIHRTVKLGKKIYNCVSLHPGYKTVKDGEVLELDGFRIECIEVPGHTMGHMCYIVDDTVLFSGDTLAINGEGGWPFWDFFCQDADLNRKSLTKLKKKVEESHIKYVCTGHSGISEDIDDLFRHIDDRAPFGRGVVFDEKAPRDVCSRQE